MNTEVDPCVDFHTFACGGWERDHVIPDDKSRYSTFTKLGESNDAKLRNLLEDESNANNRAACFYKACMDLDAIDAMGAEPLSSRMQALRFDDDQGHGEGSNGETWDAASWSSLSSITGSLVLLEVDPFIGIGAGADDKDSTQNVLWLSQSGLTLPSRDYYVDKDELADEKLAFLTKHIANSFDLFYSDASVADTDAPSNATEVALRVVRLEKTLAEIFAKQTDLRDPDFYYNKRNVTAMENVASNFDWRTYLKVYLREGYLYDQRVGENVAVPDDSAIFVDALGEDESILIEVPTYVQSVFEAIEQTPRSTVLWYLRWRLLSSFMHHLSEPFRDEAFKLSRAVYGIDQQESRWKTCAGRADYYFGYALGKLFVDRYFDTDSRSAAEEMISDVRAATRANFFTRTWMDRETQVAAAAKADAVEDRIGYPVEYDTPGSVEAHYAGWIDDDQEAAKYFGLILAGRQWAISKDASDLRKPVDRTRWGMSAPTVNAYYSPTTNQMVFPAGILQAPFFNERFPPAYNYGAIGVVMGHELTHGFDDQGSQFDASGNLAPWWPTSTRDAFEERTDCVARQFSTYSITTESGEELFVNGNLTQGENIADLGGLKQAHAAWIDRFGREAAGSKKSLPGLDLTSEQLFFVAYSQVWCSLYRDDALEAQLLTDPHSPGRFRIAGALQNNGDFARSFRCPEGSPMNPIDKCVVW
eukprot:g4284.t1